MNGGDGTLTEPGTASPAPARRVLVLTGGSRGLGYALARACEADGWEIYDLSRSGSGLRHVTVDLAHPEEALAATSALFRDLAASFRVTEARVRALGSGAPVGEIAFVNNAGDVTPVRRADSLERAECLSSLFVNLASPILLFVAFLREFRDSPLAKTAVQVSSGAANKGYAGWSLYCAGKSGVEGFIRAAREDERMAERPFRLFSFDPYIMDTGMQETLRNADRADFPQLDLFRSFRSEGRLLAAETVARALKALIEDHGAGEPRYDARHLAP